MTLHDIIQDESWGLSDGGNIDASFWRRLVLQFHINLNMEEVSSLVDYYDVVVSDVYAVDEIDHVIRIVTEIVLHFSREDEASQGVDVPNKQNPY